MIDLFDKLGNTLNDMIGSHQENNVGYVAEQIFPKGYASGGPVDNGSLASGNEFSLGSLLKDAGKSVGGSFNDPNPAIGKQSAYNSPYFLTSHIQSSWGNFFKQSDSGSTNKPPMSPQPTKVQPSEEPKDFYSRWYENMRRFAQAEEVANRGQVQTRTR